ncbi:unnamed protein product [Paramecium octaurelia]|uniref:Uncharacterized protein n=1 Tax=Paramecium octaurelia TaxID=43137 RepID=A0A8S1VNU4_PAROT|nr:unnamed protein product [Paramecium octaurelia]
MKDSKNNILFQKTMIQRFCRNFKDQFMKIQNLEFQTGLIEMQMQHIHKEKIQNISQLDSNQHKFNKVFRAFKQECNLLKINAVESFKSVVNLAYYRNKYTQYIDNVFELLWSLNQFNKISKYQYRNQQR